MHHHQAKEWNPNMTKQLYMYKLINICRCTHIRVLYNLIKIIMKMRGIHVVIIHKMAKDFSVCGIHKYTLKEKHKIIKI